MRDDYDFSASTRNPHGEQLKQKPVTLWLDEETVVYFKQQAEKAGLPYQCLIRLQLVEWARSQGGLLSVKKGGWRVCIAVKKPTINE